MKKLILILVGSLLILASCGKAENQKEILVKIDGMLCEKACAARIEKELDDNKSIHEAKVNFKEETAVISFDSLNLGYEDIQKEIEKLGDYKVSQSFNSL